MSIVVSTRLDAELPIAFVIAVTKSFSFLNDSWNVAPAISGYAVGVRSERSILWLPIYNAPFCTPVLASVFFSFVPLLEPIRIMPSLARIPPTTYIVVPVVAFAMSSTNFAASIKPRWSLYVSANAYKYSAGLYSKQERSTFAGVFLNGIAASANVPNPFAKF